MYNFRCILLDMISAFTRMNHDVVFPMRSLSIYTVLGRELPSTVLGREVGETGPSVGREKKKMFLRGSLISYFV